MPTIKLPKEPETFSLFGNPLYKTPLRPEIMNKQKKLYDEALKNWEEDPNNADNIIWLGRRTAYLGRFRESIAIYSMGIEKHPDDPRMYRHRGHRFISLRFFEQAIDNLEKATELIEGKPDEVEPDGIPNEKGVPVSSLHFNIWYHLGLAYYLKGEFKKAIQSYEKCMQVSEIDDKVIATAHWQYMTLRRLSMEKEAEKVLERIKAEMDVIENFHYYKCLLMYKGVMSAENLLKEARDLGDLGMVTIGYGVANWHNYNDNTDKAVEILREIISVEGWAGFGYIAAEADLYNMVVRPS
ncbi:tetratricopeptide repeat protein [Candidatus Bathyarchaeota archaeon]|nr:tetratricopeptide repeat protein [Candidatus Bathyarchaeota archaeon]